MSAAVGALLREAADAVGVTQSDLSLLTGVSQPSISQYFNGVRPITVDVLAALCTALGVDAGRVLHTALARGR